MSEITFELTNYCPNNCKFCSSDAGPTGIIYLHIDDIINCLSDRKFDIINLSGGEPLSHPQLWKIIMVCREHLTELGELWLYSNMIDGIRYNLHVRDRVKIHANVTVDADTEEVHVLKRQYHGRETKRPKITESGTKCESCDHQVIRPNGAIEKPCKNQFYSHPAICVNKPLKS